MLRKQCIETFYDKVIIVVVCFFSMISISTLSANARTGDPLEKESKKAAKTMKAEGWQVYGSGKSIKEALDVHYKALGQGNGNLTPLEVHAKANDINLAIRKLHYNAARQYASMVETKVEGSTHTQINQSSDDEASNEMKFSADYQSSIAQTVKSLKPTVIFYRTISNGWVEVRAFYLVDTL
jgi:hypothetical protein